MSSDVSGIDWDDVRARVAAISRTADERATLSAAQRDKLLRERAIELARRVDEQSSRVATLEIVRFDLRGTPYGIAAEFVLGIRPLEHTAAVPGLPAHFAGVTQLAGAIVPMLHIGALIEGPLVNEGRQGLVLGRGVPELCLVVDAADDLFAVPVDTLNRVQSQQQEQAPLVRGVTPEGLIILDARAILTDARTSVTHD